MFVVIVFVSFGFVVFEMFNQVLNLGTLKDVYMWGKVTWVDGIEATLAIDFC